jgi:hypothetical protein
MDYFSLSIIILNTTVLGYTIFGTATKASVRKQYEQLSKNIEIVKEIIVNELRLREEENTKDMTIAKANPAMFRELQYMVTAS